MKKALSLLLAMLLLFSCFGSVFATGEAPAEEPVNQEAPAQEAPAQAPAEQPVVGPEQPVVGPELFEEPPMPAEDEPVKVLDLKDTYSGQCGDSLYWQLDTATGVLRIYGTGAMYDYDSSDNRAPWYQYRTSMTSVTLEEGITKIGNYAFYSCGSFTNVNIPASLQTIGNWAFCYTTSLTSFDVSTNSQYFANEYNGGGVLLNKAKDTLVYYTAGRSTSYGSGASYNVPATVTTIGTGAFIGAYYLDRVCFFGDIAKVGESAFFNCTRLSAVVFMGNAQRIEWQAFRRCTNLRTIVFLKDKPSFANTNAFLECPEDLYVYYTGYYAYSWAPNGETEWEYGTDYSLPMAVYSGAAWVPVELIIADAYEDGNAVFGVPYLIELRYKSSSGTTKHCIGVTYSADYGYYYTLDTTKLGLSAPAEMNGSSIVGVNGRYATDIAYCQWRFEKAEGASRYSISSVNDYNYKLNKDCYPEALSSSDSMIWYYSANDLYNYQNRVKYHATYSWLGGLDWMTVLSDDSYTSQTDEYTIHLYRMLSVSFIPGYSGKCGDNLYWQINSNTGELRIFGTGDMYTYSTSSSSRAPWYQYRSEITSVVIEEGATKIGSCAFDSLSKITAISIPASVTVLNSTCFAYTPSLVGITVAAGNPNYCDVDGVLFNKQMTSLYCYPASRPGIDYEVPEGVISLQPYAFCQARKLDRVTLPESLNSIGAAAFTFADMLTTVIVRGKLTSLGGSIFYYAARLRSIVFLNEAPSSMPSSTFTGLSNADLYIYYTEPYTYSWAPNGETEWNYDGTNTLPLAVFGGEAWVPTETVIANDYNTWRAGNGTPQLVGIKKDGVTQIMVAYNEYASGEWPENNGYYDVGVADAEQLRAYASPAVKNGNHVVGVNGTSATDLAYCEWFFEGEQNAAPYNLFSAYQYRTQIRTCEVYTYVTTPVLSPKTMYYSNHTLYGNNGTGASGYMYCYAQNNYNLIGPGSSQYANENAQLYRKLTLDITAIGGKCGDTLYWQLDPDTGVLRIFGTGAMYNYSDTTGNRAPWNDYASEITSVVVEEGATTVGAHAFNGCYRMTEISLPSTLTTFYYNAVFNTPSLEAFVVAEENNSFFTIDGVLFTDNTLGLYPQGKKGGTYTVPDGISTISIDAFAGTLPDTIILPESINEFIVRAFENTYCLSNIIALGAPPAYVGQGVFNNCNSELCIYYTAAHASEWAPNGETTWKGIPIYLIDGETWFVTSYINPGEDYLIGFVDGDDTHLAVNYNVNTGNYYLNISANYYGWSAPAYKNGTAVTGVHGNADDLLYCSWRFRGESECLIESAYESGYYLQSYSGTSYGDLYAGTNSNYKWTYDPADMVLWTYTTDYRYANYYTDGTNDLMRVSDVCDSMVRLYHKIDLPIDEPEITYGDVDGDGLVTMADVTLLSMYLNGENPEITEQGMINADANQDGTVDIRDIAAIYAIIAAS